MVFTLGEGIMIETDRIRQAGFSLVELMVVVAISGILTMVAVPAYMNYVYRTRQYDSAQVLMAIKTAEETFRADTGVYSSAIKNLDGFGSAGTYYTSGYYRYSIASTATAHFKAVAEGDLNKDGYYYDRWTISDTANNPVAWPVGSGKDEGFQWSILTSIFN